jgi:hypothetical protein
MMHLKKQYERISKCQLKRFEERERFSLGQDEDEII